jgi:hypothetical protein
MADSIAKLAVIITGDAGPLAAALQKAQANVSSWGRGMATMAAQNDKWLAGLQRMHEQTQSQANPFAALNLSAKSAGSSIDRLHAATFKMNTLMSAMRGNVGAAFAVGGPAALGIAAMTLGVFKLANAGDHLLQKIGADKLETWAGQWERVNEQLGIMGLRFTTIAREASGALADTLAGINQALFPDAVAQVNAIKAREAAEKQMALDKEKAAKAAKEQAQANKEAAEAQQKERDALLDMANAQRDRGDAIKESMMTPVEQLRAAFIELRGLLSGGFIDDETAMRAGEAAAARFKEAMGGQAATAQDRPGVAAANRFTMAGFSAVQSGLRELDRKEEMKKLERLARQGDKANEQRGEILEVLRNQKPIALMEGNPP